ncbi:hypothetical protein QBC37DRAFT_176918 [Rhypophila decipiens]|uniref:Uncharacterized protein n=1 Tax=Rhypophila decipiens TaxID=261697 RepID=A0AAN6YHD3_9PEZI|nr:hypothetical protein QBC37DRAFT_176918 [Rhypophila decipiens]
MSISRAFTTRRVKQSLMAAEGESIPSRSNTTKDSFRSIRHKISAPVELIHTTNMLSYNAPDIYPKTASSTSSSHRSDDDMSDGAPTTVSSPPTSPDVESAPPPQRSFSPEPNHLSCYFTPPAQALSPTKESAAEPPAIPQRALSHTKKSYDPLVRQRSNSRMSEQSHRTVSTKASFTFSRSSSTSTSTAATSHNSTPPPHHNAKVSTTSFSSPPPSVTLPPTPTTSQLNQSNLHRKEFSQSQHPFGPELAQVTEIAEEYGIKEKLNQLDAEEKEMRAKGLCKFSAADYLSEIQGLRTILGSVKPVTTAMWI